MGLSLLLAAGHRTSYQERLNCWVSGEGRNGGRSNAKEKPEIKNSVSDLFRRLNLYSSLFLGFLLVFVSCPIRYNLSSCLFVPRPQAPNFDSSLFLVLFFFSILISFLVSVSHSATHNLHWYLFLRPAIHPRFSFSIS